MRIYNQIFSVHFYRTKKTSVYLSRLSTVPHAFAWAELEVDRIPIMWRVSAILINGIFTIFYCLFKEDAKLIPKN